MDFSTTVAGIKLEHPIMNAAGTCKRWDGPEGIETLLRSPASAVMLGSITVEERAGNSGEVYFPSEGFSLNSLGLPNPGMPYLDEHLLEIMRQMEKAKKPLFVNVAGFSPSEYWMLAGCAARRGADLIELNLGCPNVWEGEEQKPIPSFNPGLLEGILRGIKNLGLATPCAVKLSPYSDPGLLREVAAVLSALPIVKAVTTCNTFPNGFAWNGARQAISNVDGLAGVSGPALKSIGLGQVRQFRQLLPDRIDIIGVGGIQTGHDVADYLRAGAAAVQVGTALINRGPRVFTELLSEFAVLAPA